MDRVYRIAKWNEVFENAESRKLKTLSWVAFPVDLESRGFLTLVETFGAEAPTMYGAWAALVCVASKCAQRGVLAHSNGEPMTLSQISLKARFPQGAMERMFDWATHETVAWIEVADACCDCHETETTESGESPGEPPEMSQAHDTTRHDTTGKDPELPDTTDRTDVGVRACVRDANAGPKIVVGLDQLRQLLPTMERISRVVTRDPSVTANRLRTGDRELCGVAAVLASVRFDDGWINAILQSIQKRKTAADNPWGHFRGCLIKATTRRGENFHELEESIVLPKFVGNAPAPSLAAP